jgi:hypothetical protein
MNKKAIFLSILVALMVIPITVTSNVYAEECEDITGEESWGSESHGDNSPSEKKFDKLIFGDKNGEGQGTACEVAECIDHMECKGEIEDHEWDEFKEMSLIYPDGISEKQADCIEDRFNLPDDDGNKHLADYELQKCMTGDY